VPVKLLAGFITGVTLLTAGVLGVERGRFGGHAGFFVLGLLKPGDITKIRPSYNAWSERREVSGFAYELREEISLLGDFGKVFNLKFYNNKSSRLTTDCGEEEKL
jgi:hypothetical protein